MAKQSTPGETTQSESPTMDNKVYYLSSILEKREFKAVQQTGKGFEEVTVTNKNFVPPTKDMVYLLANDLANKKTISGTDDEAPRTVYEKVVVCLPLENFFMLFAKDIMKKSDTKNKKETFVISDKNLAEQCRDLFFISKFITASVYFKKYPTEFLTNEISEDAKLEIAEKCAANVGKTTLGTLQLNIRQCLHIPNVILPSDNETSLLSVVPDYLKSQLSL